MVVSTPSSVDALIHLVLLLRYTSSVQEKVTYYYNSGSSYTHAIYHPKVMSETELSLKDINSCVEYVVGFRCIEEPRVTSLKSALGLVQNQIRVKVT